MEFSAFLLFAVWTSSMTYLSFGKERERAMVFPDYYFFAERRLVKHTIETRKVENFDDCELLCYLNDNCVSLNFKKDPDKYEVFHICELNNATHLKHDNELATDARFYYRGSKNACDKSSNCQNNATCQSGFTFKGYRCLCPPGFEGERCEKDTDKCEASTGRCHKEATCNNTHGSYVCICKSGFIGDGNNCTDVDECKGNHSCHENANCTNTIGSHVCYCQPGYTGNGQNCTDIDECETYPGKCPVNATCNNTNGSHVCTCKPGYTGDGRNCTDIDECKDIKMNECHPNASCINTQGSYNCSCNPTYIGNGFKCQADPCYHYKNLSAADRNINKKTLEHGPVLCDSPFPAGWYRFVGAAGTNMPTTRVPAYRCTTDWSGWLVDAHPTVEDGEVKKKVCFSDRHSGCKYSNEISVKNCESYFIYKLYPLACNSRYCGTDGM